MPLRPASPRRRTEQARGARRAYNQTVETTVHPRSYEVVGDQFLAIVWEDGHESFFEAPYLRKRCPCAGCRTGKPVAPVPAPSGLTLFQPPPRLLGFDEVGRYALRLRWSDGHTAGLYDFPLLRSLCPCGSCPS